MRNYIQSIDTNLLSLSTFIVVISCVSGAIISNVSYPFFTLCALLTAIAVISFGWKLWWLCFPVFAFIGSNINVGFKIYPEEIGFALSCAILIILIYFHRAPVLRRNNKLNLTFLVLINYILIHMIVSILVNQSGMLEGAGSIIRVYVGSLTWLIFSCLLYRYSSSQQLRFIFVVIFFVLMIRSSISAIQLSSLFNNINVTTAFLVLPSLDELRLSALLSIYIGIIVYYLSQSWFVKTAISLYIVALVYLVMLGQGRVSTASAIMLVALWIVLTKKLKIIVPIMTITIVVLVTLNINKSLFSNLPFQAQRAISFVSLEDALDVSVSKNTSGSDAWHKELLSIGLNKWRSSARSVVFGNVIDPTDSKDFIRLPYNRMLEVAANTARYENALGTILATLGLVGFCLYVKIFWLLLKEIVFVVIKKGIKDYNTAVYGVAFLSSLLFVIFIWIRGGFPGYELLFCVMAKMLYDDTKSASLKVRSQAQS